MYRLAIFPFLFCFVAHAQDALPKVAGGKIERFKNFGSKYVTARNVDVWLPKGYSARQKYAVLYMHDGQMLFDSSLTWNKQAWDVDDVASALQARSTTRKFIVVGIWNGGQTRHSDYFPQKPFDSLSQEDKDTVSAQLQRSGRATGTFKPASDGYLKFIVSELKPFIDARYSVYTNAENTFVAGSSMGALISLYAICEYPHVFGGAACLSTHWTGTFTTENNPMPRAFLHYLSRHLPNPKTHKIYFDCGDQDLDALYPPIQKQVDEQMKTCGYTSKSWLTRYFPGEGHSEKSWSKRLSIPLRFLLKRAVRYLYR